MQDQDNGHIKDRPSRAGYQLALRFIELKVQTSQHILLRARVVILYKLMLNADLAVTLSLKSLFENSCVSNDLRLNDEHTREFRLGDFMSYSLNGASTDHSLFY